jgi:hypothetical protein
MEQGPLTTQKFQCIILATWILKRESQFQFPQRSDHAVPRYEPKWDPENYKDECSHNDFIHCILDGLRKAKVKLLNYSQITVLQQGPLETPVAFLQRLKDVLQKHTKLYQSHRKRKFSLKLNLYHSQP